MSHDYGAYPKVHHMDLQRLRGGAERSEVEHLKRDRNKDYDISGGERCLMWPRRDTTSIP